ncbi:MAG TPA: hypothetical protein PLG17_05455 [Thermodesulfobacteriota bacterium]|nr:hypothetical protein [Thermodesulfobacteriota bacterium]HQO77941.1 hypothetical protein [Thermodesulfobacteriota bacterium]
MGMKARTKLLTALFSVMVFSLSCGAMTLFAQDCRVIRVHGGYHGLKDRIEIEPQTTWIAKGSCVIWMNWIKTNQKVKIVFEDGKHCHDLTEAPVGFTMSNVCYVTSWIPLGGTSSLLFKDEGTFEYIVEVEGGTKAQGKIIVQCSEE